ncbi:hypothetical protein [Luteibacter sp. Lutesp34]|uniref:hypothetical protein n=1 Tax=Luteibacter sp. Lutesp34 TaxID=3243030 RepID=UPI0039B404C7
MRIRRARRSSLLLPLFLLTGPVYAKGCLFHPSQDAPQKVSFGLVTVPTDAKPGTVLAERTSTPRLTYAILCPFPTRTSILNLFKTPSGIGGGIYETNVPGIGIRVSFDYGGGSYFLAPESTYIGRLYPSQLRGARVELVVTGPVTSGGKLHTGTLAGAGYDGHVQAMVELADARVKPQEMMCPFLASQASKTVRAPAHAGGPEFLAVAGGSYASVVFKVRESAAERQGQQLRVEHEVASDPMLRHLEIGPVFRAASAGNRSDPHGLRRYFRVAIPDDRQTDLHYVNRVVASLAQRDDVELAYPDVSPVVPGTPDTATGGSRKPRAPLTGGTLHDHTFRQFYLYPADASNGIYRLGGIDAHYAARQPGGNGEGVTMVTMEPGAWDPAHPDLPRSVRNFGEYRVDHNNTATAGILAAVDNGFGIKGIASRAALAHASSDVGNFVELREYLKPGDVLVTAFAAASAPIAGCATHCMLPVEYMPAWFDAIKDLTDRGIVVVESAGDSGIDLDHPSFGGRFDRSRRDSGAILVAGLCAMDARRSPSSNFGARIDSASWSCGDVFTTAGNSHDDEGSDTVGYTATHAGTPAAGAIVAGAAASVLGYAHARHLALSSTGVRSLLHASGTPLAGGDSRTAGTQPDLKKAFVDIDDCAGSVVR